MALSPPLFVSQKPNPNNDATLLQPTSWNRMVDLLNHTFDSQDPTGSILTRDTTDPIDGAKWLHLPGSATLYLDGTGNFSTPPGSGGTGNVTGPASAVIGDVAIFSSTTGKAISDSGKTLPTGALVGLTDTQTLTNKTLASPTLQTPTISDFSLAVHTHMTVAQGGRLSELALNLTDVTTANATTALHGFLPKLSGLSTQVLNGVGNWVALSAGNVTGPVGAATNNVVTFADTTGTLIKDSGIASANLPLLNAGNVFTLNQTIQTSGMPPALFLTDAAGAANQKRIGLYNNAAKFQVTAIDDALSTFTVMASLTRAGVLTATSFVGANATTSAQGLLPTLSGVATQFLNGAGAWTTPGSGGVAGADKQIQFNQAGAFGAQATLTYDRAFFDLVLTNGGADGTGGTGNVPAVILQQTQDLRKTRLYGYACGSFLTHNRSYDISASGFDDPSQISLILGMGGTWGCGFAREGPSGAGFVDLLTVDFNGLAKAQLGLQIGSTGAAQSGQIRLGNTDTVSTRNAANTADYILIGSTGSDGITIGATGHPVGVPDTLTAQGNLIGKSFQTLDTYYIIQETASTGPQVVFVNPGAPSGAKNWAWSFDSSTGPLYLHTYADTTWYPSTTPLQINPDGSVVIGGALTATHFVGANATTSAQGLLPTLSGSATQYLNGTGAWSTPAGGGGGGTPGGANTQVQFNASGAFGGSANFTYDTTYHSLLLTNGSDTAHVPVLTLQNTPDVRKTRFFGWNQSLWITFNDDWSITSTPDDATKRSLYLWIDDPDGGGFSTKDAGPENAPWHDLLWTDLAGNVIAYNSLGVGPLNAAGSTNTLAQSGAIRLQNTATITWRNAANTADIPALGVDVNNALLLGNACPYIEILAGALCAPTNSFDLGSPSGQFRAGYFGTSAIIGQGVGNGSILVHGDSSSTSSLRLSADSSYARVNTSAGHDLFLGVGGTDCWFIDPYYGNAGWMPNGDNTRDIGVASNRVRNVAVGTAVSIGTNPAQSGAIRLANNQGLYARNAANTADIPLIGTNGSDQVLINGTVYAGGNVTGPSTSVVNNLATYNNTTGTLLKDSGIAAANIALLNVSNAFTANIVLSSNGATFVQTDTSAVANSRVIAFSNAAQKWTIISYDDAYGTPVNMLDVTRGGNATIYGTIKERGRTTPLGEWIDVGFTASNFTSNTGTWTVTSGGQQTYAYMVIGKTLWIILSIIQTNSTITGTPTELWVTLPSGFTVAPSGVPNGVTYAGPAVGAGYPIGYAYTLAGESKVRLIRDPTASGTFAAGAIGIWATFSLRIQ